MQFFCLASGARQDFDCGNLALGGDDMIASACYIAFTRGQSSTFYILLLHKQLKVIKKKQLKGKSVVEQKPYTLGPSGE
jgi:hypothetical protein